MSKRLIIFCAFIFLSGCIEADISGAVNTQPIDINVPPLPCIDGWYFSYQGEPLLNYDTGEQLKCGWRLAEDQLEGLAPHEQILDMLNNEASGG